MKKTRERKILTPAKRKKLIKLLKKIQGSWSDMEETTEEFMKRVRHNKYEIARVRQMKAVTF